MYKTFSYKGKKYRINLTHYVEFFGGMLTAIVFGLMFLRG